jgi:hypothetical protein
MTVDFWLVVTPPELTGKCSMRERDADRGGTCASSLPRSRELPMNTPAPITSSDLAPFAQGAYLTRSQICVLREQDL